MINIIQFINEEITKEFCEDNTTHIHKFKNTIMVREGLRIFAQVRFIDEKSVLFSVIDFGRGLQYELLNREKKNEIRVEEIEKKIKKILHDNNISFIDVYYNSNMQGV